MTPYTAPGLGLDEARIIELICFEFNLPDTTWVKSPSRETDVKIARQLLVTCLIDHCGYSQRSAGAACNRDHATAYHSREQIMEVFWYDRQYGERVRCVYNRCIEERKGVMRRATI